MTISHGVAWAASVRERQADPMYMLDLTNPTKLIESLSGLRVARLHAVCSYDLLQLTIQGAILH